MPNQKSTIALSSIFCFIALACSSGTVLNKDLPEPKLQTIKKPSIKNPNKEIDTIVLGAGCFWCIEAVYQQLEGVLSVESGYSNGDFKNPSYREVCSGTSGHVEVAKIRFDAQKISLLDILEVFWYSHDPTLLNQQGADKGTQYRSGIYYINDYQNQMATYAKEVINSSGVFSKNVVTEIEPLLDYAKAEEYHQDFYTNNGEYPYCKIVIDPKIEKIKKLFKDKIKG